MTLISWLSTQVTRCLKKKESEVLHGRCDSFAVETHVHFPTDINLLFDAMRKVISLCAELCERQGTSDWRQHVYNVKHVKRLMRTAQHKKRARAQTDEQKQKRESAMREAHQHYIDTAQQYLNKTLFTLETYKKQPVSYAQDRKLIQQIETFACHAHRQIDQIRRRVMLGEKIPHHEKVFSLFQPHTEWIAKGKAGVLVELGVKVCVLEDQYQFILHHQVMENKTDEQVAVPMVDETQQRFAQLSTCSFDKGFHSPANQQALSQKLDVVALKRKGRLSQAARAFEESEAFIQARHKHSAVESAINALEVHGLDRCPDQGIDGFKRYVALAIVARNIHRIGTILKQQEQKQAQRKRKREGPPALQKLAA